MPFRYYINPAFNVILLVGQDIVTGAEYFDTANAASQDKLRTWGMVTVIDILAVETDFDLQDIKRAIAFNDTLPKAGLEPERVIAFTVSRGMHFIGETFKLLPSKIPLKFEVVSTLEELISLLGISERKQEFISFYYECKADANASPDRSGE